MLPGRASSRFSPAYSVSSRVSLERLNSDGSLDADFSAIVPPYYSGISLTGSVKAIALQSDGSVLLGGHFHQINGQRRAGVARLYPDGSLDESFDPDVRGVRDFPLLTGVRAVAVQLDGKILIGGFFSRVGTTTRNGIARLNHDGSLDSSFNPGTGLAGDWFGEPPFVGAIAVQANGKVLIGGLFTSFNEFSRQGIARLNADGSLDTSFHAPPLDAGPDNGQRGSVASLALQPDGKILITGSFGTLGGVWLPAARLNPDGSLDESFNRELDKSFNAGGLGWDGGSPRGIALQADGKILVTVSFYDHSANRPILMARLNPDGSLDKSFDLGAVGWDENSYLYNSAVALQQDGKVLVAGTFSSIDGVARFGLARFNGDPPLRFAPITAPANGEAALTLAGPAGRPFILEASANLLDWVSLITTNSTGNAIRFVDTDAVNFPRRFYRARLVEP